MRDWLKPVSVLPSSIHYPDSSSSHINVPLLTLPHLFKTQLSSIPSHEVFTNPLSEHPHHLRLKNQISGLSVGLAWSSDPNNERIYAKKSIPLDNIILDSSSWQNLI